MTEATSTSTSALPGDALSVPMLGLEGFVVLAAGHVGGELEVLIETDPEWTGPVACTSCGALATTHGRRAHLVRDVPAHAPVTLVWCKRIWRCQEAGCPRRTWSEQHPAIPPRSVLTARARQWATRRVGDCEDTVAVTGRELGVGWHTVWRAVGTRAEELLAEPARLDGVAAVGVDEHVVRHEALLFRMEVRDLRRFAVAAAG